MSGGTRRKGTGQERGWECVDGSYLTAFSQVLMSYSRMHSDCVYVCWGRTEGLRGSCNGQGPTTANCLFEKV